MFNAYFKSFQGLPGILWHRVIIYMINTISGGLSFYLAFYFVQDLHIAWVMAGFLVSCYGIGTVLGGLLGGWLADRFHPDFSGIAALVIKTLLFLLLLVCKVPWALIPIMFLFGLCTYVFKAVNNVVLLRGVGPDPSLRLKIISVMYAGMNFGLAISAVIVMIFFHFGFQWLFILSALLMGVSCVYLFCRMRLDTMTSATLIEIPLHPKTHHTQSSLLIVSVALGFIFLSGLIFAQLSAAFPIYLHQSFPRMGLSAATILFILNSFIIVIAQVPLTHAFRKMNPLLTLGLGACLLGVGFGLMVFTFSYAMMIASCVVATIGEMLAMSVSQLLVFDYASSKHQGQMQGFYQAAYATGCVIGPTLGMWIYHTLGGKAIWNGCSVIGVVYLCVMLGVWRRKKYMPQKK